MYAVKHKDARPFMQFEIGTADPGLSKDYVFNRHNEHEVVMTNADAEKLMRSGNSEDYEFQRLGDDTAAAADSDSE